MAKKKGPDDEISKDLEDPVEEVILAEIEDEDEDDPDLEDPDEAPIEVEEGPEEEPANTEETDEALDELEAEELELIDDEVSESLLVDEAAELRAIRREELTLNVDAQAVRAGEFVCQLCFLVKRSSQLANRKKMICFDCASDGAA